ncbi:MAG: glycosyltransferase family 2 protein [Cyanobacteria bacterium P01_D01_bin.14]
MPVIPNVSVIIPTRNRPNLVVRAVHSALRQTLTEIEVIVVIDGVDPTTQSALAEIQDDRLAILELTENQGAPNARNQGVLKAQSPWIAFLDDDDEWFPEKLEKQLEIAQKFKDRSNSIVVACRLQATNPHKSYVVPRRLPDEDEPISEYLFVRKGIFRGEGSVITSTLLASRDLLLAYPFTPSLRRHQEADWILRVWGEKAGTLTFLEEPLGILHVDQNRPRVSETGDWRYSLQWIKDRHHLVTPKAYSAFILSAVTALAAREKAWLKSLSLLWEAQRYGRPSFTQYLLFLSMWIFPQDFRRTVREKWFSRQQRRRMT